MHDRYKDLTRVEWAFRDSKSVHLEMWPVYLRAEKHTRGHAVVVMLTYLMAQELRRRWRNIDPTVQEGLDRLASLCVTDVRTGGRASYNQVPTPRGRPPIIRSRQHRHTHRAAARSSPLATEQKLPRPEK